MTDPQGYDTTVAVYNLDTTKQPDPNMFRIDYTRIFSSRSLPSPSLPGLTAASIAAREASHDVRCRVKRRP